MAILLQGSKIYSISIIQLVQDFNHQYHNPAQPDGIHIPAKRILLLKSGCLINSLEVQQEACCVNFVYQGNMKPLAPWSRILTEFWSVAGGTFKGWTKKTPHQSADSIIGTGRLDCHMDTTREHQQQKTGLQPTLTRSLITRRFCWGFFPGKMMRVAGHQGNSRRLPLMLGREVGGYIYIFIYIYLLYTMYNIIT